MLRQVITLRRLAFVVGALLLLAAGAVLAHLEARWPHWRLDFGDVPTWAAAIGAAIATAFAGSAFQLQRRQLQELDKRQEISDRLLTYQAHIAAVSSVRKVVYERVVAKLMPDSPDQPTKGRIIAIIGNEAEGAIVNVTFRMRLDSTELLPDKLQWGFRHANGMWSHTGANAPLGPVKLLPGQRITAQANLPHAIPDDKVEVTARFTDEVGTRWQYNQDKTLVMAPDEEW